jgi:hypothetical protein
MGRLSTPLLPEEGWRASAGVVGARTLSPSAIRHSPFAMAEREGEAELPDAPAVTRRMNFRVEGHYQAGSPTGKES